MTLNGLPDEYSMMGEKVKSAMRCLEETITGLGTRRLEHGAGYPTLALVVHGIGALQIGEAAVLRLERGLQSVASSMEWDQV